MQTRCYNTQRGTNLEIRVKIQTPEHVLAALVGCDLDNDHRIKCSELPIMDGSSNIL
jgi:UDP-3-O-[3-hydroxymyristoyl] N-acetylglucosamine deacetylase/3-hydroxyacyl-[acyl-carrier-protein] dehydratase